MTQLTDIEWEQAIRALDPNNYVEVDDNALIDDLTPESYYMIKETINSVSNEARSVFQILMNIPSEITAMGLRSILKDLGWTRRKTNEVLKELKPFALF